MDISIPGLTLFAFLLFCLYISLKCLTPPHTPSPPSASTASTTTTTTPTSTTPYSDPPQDSLKIAFAASALHLWFAAFGYLFIYQLLLILFPSLLTPSNPLQRALCLNPRLLSPALTTWSRPTIVFGLTVLLSGSLRLEAFRELGANFTFVLARPSTLVQTGLYRYIQHPSYTGLIPFLFAWYAMLLRLDGILACYLPEAVLGLGIGTESWLWEALGKWLLWGVMAGLSVLALKGRVREEEAMMKREFGGEWVEWSGRTRRFIPGVW